MFAFLVTIALVIQPPLVIVAPAGTYTVNTPAPTTITQTINSITFSWGESPPAPQPTPPQPVPPQPTPQVPIPVPGLRVLITYETADLSKYPAPQVAMLYSKELRSYLGSVTVIGFDGKTNDYRFWDQNVDVSHETQLWKDAFARPRGKLPWILISNGEAGYEGPLPVDTGETIALIKKYVVAK